MNARAAVSAVADKRGGTRLAVLRSEAPLALRSTPDGVYLVGTAAGPLGGDRLVFDIDVGPGATLTLRSAAASLVFPGPARAGNNRRPAASVVEVNATVATGAALVWLVEPLIAIDGCRHAMRARINVESGGRVLWREELVLGRHGEVGGSVASQMSLDIADRPVLRHELVLDHDPGGWGSCAVGGGAHGAGSIVVVEPAWEHSPLPPKVLGPGSCFLPLAGPAAQVTALADDARSLRAALERGLEMAGLQREESERTMTETRKLALT